MAPFALSPAEGDGVLPLTLWLPLALTGIDYAV